MEHILTRERWLEKIPQRSLSFSAARKSSRKRRKVNHACVYCRRSERPCARCIKRNIGHLCHDEPRKPEIIAKNIKCLYNPSAEEDDNPPRNQILGSKDNGMGSSFEHKQDLPQDGLTIGPEVLPQGSLQIVEPSSVSGIHTNAANDRNNQYMMYSNNWPNSQSDQFHEIHNYYPPYKFNAPEVSAECNLLDGFLDNSLLDDGTLLPGDLTSLYNDQLSFMLPSTLSNHNDPSNSQLPGPIGTGNLAGNVNSKPTSEILTDKACEYYLQAADPAGNDTPEKRIENVFQTKHEAGMLKPFDYDKGYARLSTYMDRHLQPEQKMKILRQLEWFRPKFRERVKPLSLIELISIEKWFECKLMQCDRQFASMALPSCCWRITGEIFRGNKEMAELIHVPTENLRDGIISLHDILDEESLVNYWEGFGAISFDEGRDHLYTNCYLKEPGDRSTESIIKCCFMIKIERDDHKIPSLIIGNFLPEIPVKPRR